MENINIDSESFQNFLNINNGDNSRIIFSAKFGQGKSTFFNKFMSQTKDKYNYIVLRPINYQIANNKDILEYIKFDILRFLILEFGKTIDNEKIQFSLYDRFSYYFSENPSKILTNIIPFLSSIIYDDESANAIENVLSFVNTIIKKITKKTDSEDTNAQKVNQLGSDEINKLGSIYENNFFTILINDLLSQIKDDNKKNILLIEDLDRIDPEHIFRILNVFSAHFDLDVNLYEGGIKFDFDHTILVCDIYTIESVYYHKYGDKANFSGYINKFISSYIYEYSIANIAKEIINDNDFKYQDKYKNIKSILLIMFECNAISILELIKMIKNLKLFKHYKKEVPPDIDNAYFLLFLKCLVMIFGIEQLKIRLKKCIFESIDRYEFRTLNKYAIAYMLIGKQIDFPKWYNSLEGKDRGEYLNRSFKNISYYMYYSHTDEELKASKKGSEDYFDSNLYNNILSIGKIKSFSAGSYTTYTNQSRKFFFETLIEIAEQYENELKHGFKEL